MRDTETPTVMSLGDECAIRAKIFVSMSRIRRAIDGLKPVKVIGLLSGGHDSFSATYCMVEALNGFCSPCDFEVVHINTGFGIEATREYVRQTCKDRNWPFREMKATENTKSDGTPDPVIYEDWVRKYGFPGPGWHGVMYQRLKERSLMRLERLHGANCRGKHKKRVMYINGCRSQESKRRMANTVEVQVQGRRIWVAPIHDWSKLDTSMCLELAKQPRNEVVDLIHMSGECLCGAMADDNRERELEELSRWPITRPAYDRIMALQQEVKSLHPWGWGERPPRKPKACKTKPGQLCWSCIK